MVLIEAAAIPPIPSQAARLLTAEGEPAGVEAAPGVPGVPLTPAAPAPPAIAPPPPGRGFPVTAAVIVSLTSFTAAVVRS